MGEFTMDHFKITDIPMSGNADGLITIATSLAPGKDIKTQIQAVRSWMQQGFNVVSLNAGDEITMLEPYFSNIRFIKVNRDARAKFDKPYVYFDDVIAYFKTIDSPICGIVNSDIHLLKEDFYDFVSKAAVNSFVYGSRVDIETLDNLNGGIMETGFDYFFFDRKIISLYPQSEFYIGLPHWDYWVVLVPLFNQIPINKITTHHAYHIKHQQAWDRTVLWTMFKTAMLPYFNSVSNMSIEEFEWYVFEIIIKYSVPIHIAELSTKGKIDNELQISRTIYEDKDVRIIDNLRFTNKLTK